MNTKKTAPSNTATDQNVTTDKVDPVDELVEDKPPPERPQCIDCGTFLRSGNTGRRCWRCQRTKDDADSQAGTWTPELEDPVTGHIRKRRFRFPKNPTI